MSCRTCDTALPPRKPGKGRPRLYCDQCRADRAKDRALGYSQSHRAKRRAILLAAKDKPCVDCGIQYPSCVMDLDHVRGVKSCPVNELERRGSYADLYAEIAKCDVRCSNCHRLRHHGSDSATPALD